MRIRISHANVQFGGDMILQDINFEVRNNEKIAIAGRNGCGKTTLLKLIAGDISMSNIDSDEECGYETAGRRLDFHHIKRYAGNYTAFMKREEEDLVKQKKERLAIIGDNGNGKSTIGNGRLHACA